MLFLLKVILKNNKHKILAIVISTGFKTVKGSIIKSILFPKEIENKFEKDSKVYIKVMSIISIFGFFVASFLLIRNGVKLEEVVVKSASLITIIVPPALPACISIGIFQAINRIKNKGITCIDREKITDVGRVDIVLFDKTGTLTEETLDISGVLPISYVGRSFCFGQLNINLDSFKETYVKQDKIYHNKENELTSLIIECFACCHSLNKVNHQILGDIIDLKIFEMTGFVLNECSKGNDVKQI